MVNHHEVCADTTDDDLLSACSRIEIIITGATIQGVITTPAIELIIVSTAIKDVVASLTKQVITSAIAIDRVVSISRIKTALASAIGIAIIAIR